MLRPVARMAQFISYWHRPVLYSTTLPFFVRVVGIAMAPFLGTCVCEYARSRQNALFSFLLCLNRERDEQERERERERDLALP